MEITEERLRQIIQEELTKWDMIKMARAQPFPGFWRSQAEVFRTPQKEVNDEQVQKEANYY